MDQKELVEKIKEFLDKGYNYEETLKRMSFGQKDVTELKERLKKVPNIPIVQEKLVCDFIIKF